MLEGNKELVRRAFEALWVSGEESAIDALFAADYVYHTAALGTHGDLMRIKRVARRYRAAPSAAKIEDQIAEMDRVVSLWTGILTHSFSFLGVPATGKRVDTRGIVISRIAGGKVAEEWYHDDFYSVLRQLGAAPPIKSGSE